jgi:exosortase E/protease (VPEID-CTERM system)
LQSSIVPTIEPLPSSPALGLTARLSILGALYVLELLAISIWLDAELLHGRGALANLVHDWGASSLRLAVALALGSLIFAESRARGNFNRISDRCATFGIGWPLLAAHAGGMGLFVWLSWMLFQHSGPGALANWLVLLWGLTGIASSALAACALIPVRVWIEIFRSTGDAWIFGLTASVVAVTLGTVAQKLWPPLSHWTLSMVATMLRPFVSALVVDPSTMSIGTQAFHVEISQECSGYEGMGLILAFSSAWLWFFRSQWRFPQALLLLPAGVAIMWIANSARIAGLILLGIAGAPQIALGGFHSQAGWIAFNAVAIGMCVLALRIPALVHQEEHKVESANPTAPYLMPFLAILAAAMISRALSSDFEWFYSLRVIAAAGALWYFRRSYRELDWRCGWLAIATGVVVFGIWIGLEPRASSAAPVALVQATSTARIAWLTLRVIGAVTMVPIAEELAFRGFLLRRLASSDFEAVGWRTFSWIPFLISSVAFGILHGERWLAGTIAGALFALVQLRRGRIGDAIVAHAVANALVAAWVLVAGRWQLW